MKENTIIKIWDEGNLQIGRIKEPHTHPKLVHYELIKTIIAGADFNPHRHEIVSSMSNIVKEYGIISLKEHQKLYPEDWI